MASWPKFASWYFEVSRGCWACTTAPFTSTRRLAGWNVADIADFANDLVQERIDQAVAARLALMSNTTQHSLMFCDECDGPIPEARRLAQPGCTLCIECKTVDDQRAARYAR
nr:TraR/DksA family transcriptional regulator [Pseudomonas rhodesiae]